MGRSVSKFRIDPHEKVSASDLGDQWGDGFFVRDLGRLDPEQEEEKTEPVKADPVKVRRPKTVSEREEMPREMADRLMRYYVTELNNPGIVNPIRDGIPECRRHRFPPGCFHGCQTGVLPRVYGASLGQVHEWVKGLIRVNYTDWIKKNPKLKGHRSGG